MASSRDIRRRIKSVKSTAQITKAMQMVAASKMRKVWPSKPFPSSSGVWLISYTSLRAQGSPMRLPPR